MVSGFSPLQQALYDRLRRTFAGPEIVDALCNAEQIAARDGVTADDGSGLEACVQEAVELTVEESMGEREHKCPDV